jgi:Zn-dependent protease with chaperone function
MVTAMADVKLPSSFEARWFDGVGGLPRDARVVFVDGLLHVQPADAADALSFRLGEVRVAERLLRAPRLIDLPGGGALQIAESDALAAAFAASGVHDPVVVRWQRLWPEATGALLLLVMLAVWLYVEGLPRASEWAADHVSPSLEARLGDQALAVLDRRVLVPSRLSDSRQAELRKMFADFQSHGGLEPVRRIEFRSVSSGRGVNAFALPGGVIVFLDGIVELAAGDDDILLAVLAHEYGHHARHHMTRGLFRALGAVALASVIWGDYSSIASHGAVLFGQLRYSRHDESEADDFAFAALGRAGVSPDAMARFFWREDADPGKKAHGGEAPEWLSTHPGSNDRAERALEAAEAWRNAAASAPRS